MAQRAVIPMTVEEFFVWQDGQEDRYELVNGFPEKLMAGASNHHDTILVNVIAEFKRQLRGSGCRATSPDTAARTRKTSVRRPDVMVTCDEPKADGYEARPKLVVEVLSKSNSGILWERKLDEYRRLSGLIYMLLIDSLSVRATLFTLVPVGVEPIHADDLEAVFQLPEIGCTLSMRDIYDELQLPVFKPRIES